MLAKVKVKGDSCRMRESQLQGVWFPQCLPVSQNSEPVIFGCLVCRPGIIDSKIAFFRPLPSARFWCRTKILKNESRPSASEGRRNLTRFFVHLYTQREKRSMVLASGALCNGYQMNILCNIPSKPQEKTTGPLSQRADAMGARDISQHLTYGSGARHECCRGHRALF